MEKQQKNLKKDGTKSVLNLFNLLNIQTILVISVLAGIVLISGCVEEKPKPFNPDDIGNLSDIVESGPVDEKTVVNLTIKDRVAFFFLHNPGCGHCFDAEQHLPEIRQMFGQRMIIYKLKIRESESLPWTNDAINAGLFNFPFTLAVGSHSVENEIINKSNIGMTSGSGVYEEWKKNICLQFKNPPSNCSKYRNSKTE
ncbi:hypothetical protein MSIBF_A2270005 [groundwater metagenome]|uniref:Thioredoxin domain-containing protein n=1 Tax=groundwater metagenome TaxID=717931 RepID=A0A098E8R2_9ZZZZ